MHAIHPLTPPQDAIDHGRLILRDGSTANVRVVRDADRDPLARFIEKLSPDSRYRRFNSAFTPPDAPARWAAEHAPDDDLALVVTRAGDHAEEILAIGSYTRTGKNRAEVAFAVADALQNRGVGTLLLERLAQVAARHGIARFEALVDPSNTLMHRVFRDSGFPVGEVARRHEKWITLALEPDQRTVDRVDERDRLATLASLAPFFEPRAVAVVGASRSAAALGHRVLEQVLAGGYRGPVYPINPAAGEVLGLAAFPSIAAVPAPVDLAVIATPRDAVLDAVRDAAAAGVRALTVISAGFAEVGAEGAALQAELTELVRGHGMRLIGPNCLGLVNTDPRVRLNASFAPVRPPAGNVALCSQSGALGVAVLALARDLALGVSTFASIGNKADVSGNDLLQYWEADLRTKVILLYLESLGNPRRFARIARRVSRAKPIVCVKAGRTDAGRRAAGSHTAAIAGSEACVEALFAQTGVLRAETLEEMFEVAALLSTQELPAGGRVAVLTNAGGPAILCADACAAGELEMAKLGDATRRKLSALLPAAASVANPVDMIASATPPQYAAALGALLADPGVDSVIAMHVPVAPQDGERVRGALADAVGEARERGNQKPVLACVLGSGQRERPITTARETIPVYAFPESAARALAAAARYARWRGEAPGTSLDYEDIEPARARRAIDLGSNGSADGWLPPDAVQEVLAAFGIPACAARVAHTVEEAAEAARWTGYPVALKAIVPALVHKSDVGGVVLGVADEHALPEAYARLMGAVTRAGHAERLAGILVQRMADPGVELMAGLAQDPVFGPVVAFGLGGVHVEVLGDVTFRVTPLTDRDAAEMVRGIRGRRLLEGYRGHPAVDVAALEELLMRLSRLADAFPEVVELDLNPIVALPDGQGCTVVDARIRVQRGGRSP